MASGNPHAPLLEVVVVTYASCASAGREIRQMMALARSRPEVQWHFVDNSGNDAAHLRDWSDGLSNVQITVKPNPGFAAACNAAAESSRAPWLLLLNPDVELTMDALDVLVAECGSMPQDSTVAISMVTNGVRHAGVALRHGVWFVDAVVDSGDRIIGPSGGAGLYPRDLFLQQGGFFEPLFAWGEDADLAWRLHRTGHECRLLDLGLPHQGGHSVAGSAGATRFKVHSLYRNRLVVARRNLPTVGFVAFAGVYAIGLVLLLPKNARRASAGASVRGFADGIRASLGVGRVR